MEKGGLTDIPGFADYLWLSFFQKPVSGSEGPKSDGNLPEDGIFPMGVFGFSE